MKRFLTTWLAVMTGVALIGVVAAVLFLTFLICFASLAMLSVYVGAPVVGFLVGTAIITLIIYDLTRIEAK